ncbi:type II toxin-antitoxin system VapC family toxin [Pseudothauera nasutitermitis]|uniref:Ribonuclease VapC n=1 Tax=Pseudothauera nasutitermitis TaxID=2565930 RepID=A0A4S4AZN0_9RHOO|nr:type II toxin-antitoxin system VapC family toxin [Pseudothauera nasutitermitis]THF65639.1 type II toxin-antitoxin system VapC family toxin [Pseudothauera nasutitermitis]
MTPRYLLDTNAVTALLSGIDNPVSQRLRQHTPAEVAISSIVSHELFYGAFKSQRTEHNVARVDGLRFEVLPFDHEDARCAGQIRAQLAKAGTPTGPYDTLIAGQALARGMTLVTHNLAEFRRIGGLLVEDWQR